MNRADGDNAVSSKFLANESSGVPERASDLEKGPGSSYLPFVKMEELIEKLKLLNYDDQFCKLLRQKPISRHYFALVTNSGEQFSCFSLLASWLIKLCKRKMDLPQETDDPNAVIATILFNLRSLGLKPDFPPNKLKTGSGEFCIWVLNGLADEALGALQFSFKLPLYPSEKEIFDEVDAGEAELQEIGVIPEHFEDTMEVFESDDEDHSFCLDNIKTPVSMKTAEEKKSQEIMQSTVDVDEWNLEVETVLPQLKIVMKPDNKDWRIHLEHMNQYKTNVEDQAKDLCTTINRMGAELFASLEKLSSRERYVSEQLKTQLGELREARNALAEVKEIHRVANGRVAEKTRFLAEVVDELEQVKREMEERGNRMTDGTPVVKIRQAIAKAQKETQQMDIRIGVLQHMLLHHTLRRHQRFDMDNHEELLVH